MLKNRGRDPRSAVPNTPTMSVRAFAPRAPIAKPEPDYEVVEFPSEQYVNAKLQPPPPPPPRPPTGHPQDAGASCGLCGGGGARVRCTECGRRALCASCDDMYHRHPKRRHHQRLALSSAQLRDERPPLPPKTAAPVPPPRRHKLSGERSSASPRPPSTLDQRRATLTMPMGAQPQMNQMNHMATITNTNHFATQRPPIQHPQAVPTMTPHMGSMPYLPNAVHHANAPVAIQDHSNTLGHFSSWGRPRGSLQGFNMTPNMVNQTSIEPWDAHDNLSTQSWGRPLRRGTSVMELGGGPPCAGCAHCSSNPWRYGSCANLEHQWFGPGAGPWPQGYCGPHPAAHDPRMMPHPHVHPTQTPQPYRRAESRAVSRAASRVGSRAPSPAMSVRSRASRRSKHRTPSPPALPSSDADSESEMESNHLDEAKDQEDSLGPPPPPPSASWQCEHCTFVNEPGVRVCVVCCRTPTVKPKIVTDALNNGIARLKMNEKSSRLPSIPTTKVIEQTRSKNDESSKTKTTIKERTSTGCGPSPPREEKPMPKAITRLTTPPTRESSHERIVATRIHHDIAIGPSPPRDLHETQRNSASRNSLSIQTSSKPVSPLRETKIVHSVSVGPSPPRDSPMRTPSFNSNSNFQKKSAGSSPPRENLDTRPSSRASRTNTGTSPPPQSISTQTYEAPSNWDRAQSVSRSRPRRRLRDESRRERSHSRVSLSSDTRESERSVHTSSGRWEWREPRDSSPSGDWSESERRRASRLTRRASHLDLRRRPVRRSSMYGSEAPSPEPLSSNRAISLEALAGAGSRREAERGLELARLMSDAEKLGFSAAEVHAALAQNPVAPLAWLSERWPSLCAGVRAAAARLAPGINVTELEARAALARHRGAMWPAVNECVERNRKKTEVMGVGEEGRLRGHVWGPPTGADDDAAPPFVVSGRSHRVRADNSSEEFEGTTNEFQDDDWMYLPLEINTKDIYESKPPVVLDDSDKINSDSNTDLVEKLKGLLLQAGIPLMDEKLLLKGLLNNQLTRPEETSARNTDKIQENKLNVAEFIQSENDFIDAYNALTRLSPLPNVSKHDNSKTNNIANEGLNSNQTQYTDNLEAVTGRIRSISKGVNSKNKIFSKGESVNKSYDKNDSKAASNNEDVKQKNHQNIIKLDNLDTKGERPHNLNDIVDNTQRLIQQMKKEINSDINSMHDESDSQSEPGESNNESHSSSEKESSYSDTEEQESEDLTSDEKGISSSEDETNNRLEKRLSIQRTSSEDNENFEEAMDHVENDLEKFKEKNIEILNSIAKSLQEEHSVTIEFNNQNFRKNNQNIQDVNNNSFAEVDTFEEIYAQLNNNVKKRENQHSTNDQENGNNVQNLVIALEPEFTPTYQKEDIIISLYKADSPMKFVVNEFDNKLFTAVIDNIEEYIDESDSEEIDTIKENNEIIVLNTISSEQTNETPDHKIASHQIVHENSITSNASDSARRSEEINHTILQPLENPSVKDPNIESTSEDHRAQDQTDNVQNPIENPDELSVKVNNNDISARRLEENDTILQPMANPSVIEPNIENMSEDHRAQDETDNLQNPIVNSEELSIKFNNNDIINNHTNTEDVGSVLINNIRNTDTTNSTKVNSKTIEKSKTAYQPNKSNIPKLVKTIQSNKQKVEHKNLPKVIASKVPIRRGSLKQYPAPSPPKSHFGNVQSGKVKQLQTKLFNDKVVKVNIEPPPTPEVKASTSTFSKKKPAPAPPTNKAKELSPVDVSTKKKNEYFRETCRTEDEWTESDAEEQNGQTMSNKEETSVPATPSTPQPLTIRQVSGQLIDLARVRLPEGSPERQARMLLAEGATETWEQAQLAVQLISQGTDPPAALLAALECVDLSSALVYLHQDCELCASKFPEHEMVSMLRCTHRCCRECACHYFTVQITERSIVDCVCPYCKEPELENLPEDDWLDYFAHMDILLKMLLETEVHELFQRKLRDRTLARDPNFRWCVECSSGFFVHPKQKKLRCPECKSVTCANCRKPWNANHDGLSCEQYTAWLEDNDPERSIVAVQQHLKENGLECPRCHFKYSLSRGGCMHFTCTQCKYEFCYGCGKPFTMGARCGLSDYCAKLGLHAHHPRNCLFYLRDKEPHELQTLLQMNNVTYETEAADGSNNRCPIQLQRETPTGLIDTTCGYEVQPKQAGLCKNHYLEYLSRLVRGRHVDPLPILGVDDLETLVRRAALRPPPRPYGSLDGIYRRGLTEIVREKIPLD